jgi:V/A-type H+-transporting ATPase subunit C
MRLSENPEYGFAIGRVRSMEAALLDRARYDRLVRARSPEEFLPVLAETAYGHFLEGDGGRKARLPEALRRAADEDRAFIAEYAVDMWLLELLRLSPDILRLKIEIKQHLAGSGPVPQVTTALPDRVRAAAETMVGDEKKGIDPARVDIVLDQLQQETALELCRPSQFMTGYYSLHADLENLRTLVRGKATDGATGKAPAVDGAMLAGGTLAVTLITGLAAEEWDEIVGRFGATPYRGYVDDGVAYLRVKQSLTRMERLGREMELAFLRQSRYAVFGHEPLVTFFLLRASEQRNLAQLYAARVAGLPEDEAQELVAFVE